jgi:dihydroxyacetone kinase-like protein
MKKILNDPKAAVEESYEGFLYANSKTVKKIGNSMVAARIDAPVPGKVGIVIGGGSGHEPLFLEFIGKGMADVAANGRFFAAPSPDQVLEAIDAADGGKGVMLLYNNYAGDVMNFDMAQEMAKMQDKIVETVLINDDIASSTKGFEKERRGTTADLLIIKIAGSAAESGADFEQVLRITKKAVDASRSIGVALAPCTIPETGKPTFYLEEDMIEFGMGLHGEAGIKKVKMLQADEITDELIELILQDMPLGTDDEVLVLVNSYGSTTRMELFIVVRRIYQLLNEKGIRIHAADIGEFCTTQEMAGCSVTILKLDEELKKYYDMPCNSPFYKKI